MLAVVEIAVALFSAYLALGALFGLWFAMAGVTRFDPNAQGSGPAFRLILFPGVVALWPLLLMRVAAGRRAQ